MHLSVIIPCHNEEKRIGKTIQRISSYLEKQSYSYEILIVENGSTDKTLDIIERHMETTPHYHFISLKESGKGRAVNKGMFETSGNYKLFTDADNSTDIAHIEKLFEHIRCGCDIAIGSRRAAGANIEKSQGIFRAFLGHTFAHIVSLIIPLGIKDTQNGFKLFTRRAAEIVFPRQRVFNWAFDVEVLALARIFNLKIAEVPIHWVNDELSKMTLRGMVEMLIDIVRIRWRLWAKYYDARKKLPHS